MFCVRRGSSSLAAFMKTEHHFLVRQAEENAKRGTLLCRVGNQRFVTHLVIQRRAKRISSLPSQFHAPFPPQPCRCHRVLRPRAERSAIHIVSWSIDHGETDVPAVADKVDDTSLGPKCVQGTYLSHKAWRFVSHQ